MSARVVITEPARSDASDILTYLAENASVEVMQDYLTRFTVIAQDLAIFPASGAPRHRLGRDIRIRVIDPYLMVYQYDPSAGVVSVLRIVHGSRRFGRRDLGFAGAGS